MSGSLSVAVPELLYFLPQLKSHHAVPRFLVTVAERHRAGIAAGRTPVRHLVEQAISFVDRYDVPGLQHYRDVLQNDVLPHGRDMLTTDAKRAGRLVADTGLHTKGWSRQQAVDHLLDNTPMPRDLAEGEVDRYLAQPAQALAYVVGRLKFDELRTRAERASGTAFDVRDFHEVVLGHGRLTLGLLDDVVTTWIAER